MGLWLPEKRKMGEDILLIPHFPPLMSVILEPQQPSLTHKRRVKGTDSEQGLMWLNCNSPEPRNESIFTV